MRPHGLHGSFFWEIISDLEKIFAVHKIWSNKWDKIMMCRYNVLRRIFTKKKGAAAFVDKKRDTTAGRGGAERWNHDGFRKKLPHGENERRARRQARVSEPAKHATPPIGPASCPLWSSNICTLIVYENLLAYGWEFLGTWESSSATVSPMHGFHWKLSPTCVFGWGVRVRCTLKKTGSHFLPRISIT